MRADTLFRIYSMTKPVTSVALMMLHERGAFQLGDPVHKWLPGWDQLRVYRYGQYPNFVTDAGGAPDDRPRPPDAHVGPLVRHHGADAPRRRVPQARDRRRQGDAERHGREARPAPARVLARHALGLFRGDGRHRAPRRDPERTSLRRVRSRGDLRAARHGRHGVHRRRREAAALRGQLLALSRRRNDPVRRPRRQRVRAPEDALHGQLGPHLHGGRLRSVRRDAPPRRGARRRADSSARERSST